MNLSHGLISFQKERTSFLRNSTHMQGNDKSIWNKIKKISVLLRKRTRICLQIEEIPAQKVQGFPVLCDKRVKGY